MMPDNTPAATNPVINQNSASSQDGDTLPDEIKAAEEKVREDAATADRNDWYGKVALILYVVFTGLVGWTTVSSNRTNGYLRQSQNLLNNLQIAKVKADARNEEKRIEEEGKARVKEVEAKAANDKQELENKNLKLRTDLENATAESRSKQTELAQEQTKLAEEQRATAKAQAEAAKAQLALKKYLDEVAERQKPRELTAEQAAQLFERLNASPVKGRVKAECLSTDEESCRFATILSNILEKAGWPTGGVTKVTIPLHIVGVNIWVHSVPTAPPHAAILQQILTSVRLPAEGEEKSGVPEGEMRLFVGVKP